MSEIFPAEFRHELGQEPLKRDAVQRIVGSHAPDGGVLARDFKPAVEGAES
jgi:hypothetical protein